MPRTISHTLVYRRLAAISAAAVLGRGRREILNGYLDSSVGSHAREPLFELSPLQTRVDRTSHSTAGRGVAEYRFWFGVGDEEPVVCLDEEGRAWDRQGAEHDLVEAYEATGRNLGRLLWATFPQLLA